MFSGLEGLSEYPQSMNLVFPRKKKRGSWLWMSEIEKSLESKSQSISDWWNSIPSLDKLGVSGTLLVRLEDAIKEVKDLEVELKRVSKLYNSALLSVPVLTDLEIEVRVREETIREVISLCDERKYNIVTLKKKLESEVQKEWIETKYI